MPAGTILLLAIGFGTVVSANQLWRSPLTGMVTDSGGAALLSCLAALACALSFHFNKTRFLLHDATVTAFAVVSSASLYCYFLTEGEGVGAISFLICRGFDPCLTILLIIWNVELAKLRMPDLVATVAIGFAVTALVQSSQAFFIKEVAIATSVCIPLVSVSLLLASRYIKRHQSEMRTNGGDTPILGWSERSAQERSRCSSRYLPYGKPTLPFVICVTMIVYAVLFTTLHDLWSPVVFSEASALPTLLLSSLGSLVASILVLMFGKSSRHGAMDVVIVLFALVSLYLSTMPLDVPPFYLVFLNAAQKAIIFVTLLYGAFAPKEKGGDVAICTATAAYRFGLTIVPAFEAVLAPRVSESPLGTVCLVVCLAYLLAYILADLRDAFGVMHDATDANSKSDVAAALAHYKNIAFLHHLSSTYGLTSREVDVIPLLAQGKNANAIASELVISQSTAKSHLRNIYVKLDVHSLQEAMDLLERERKSFDKEA